MVENRITKNITMITVNTATSVALVFSKSSSLYSSSKDPKELKLELDDSLVLAGVVGSKELSESIVSSLIFGVV